ncbi:type I restriction endonuclease subunit R [Denitrobacterium detoxificans]|uniref:type I restriction endonuclease subunit R n=1 Tax=Denitrobacterium detoxificans TaxID=79604 RepID=UPI0026EB57BD|nr:type I restriction endonuclease subunit R [Denitrobacterium detoxificans]MBE6465990.1 type I restriction endonuclease subunit R [Denitrobacterium detoxificans]
MSGSTSSMSYSSFSMPINEDFYEQVVIEHLRDDLGYDYLYGPDVARTSDKYDDVFLPGVLPSALRRINPALPERAIQEAVLKLDGIDAGSLEQRNERFNDYLQSGVEVHFFDGKEERDDIVYLLDFDDPDNNDFHVVNQWTFVEYSEKRPDVIVFVNGMPLVIFELKSPSREETDASDAYLQLRQYMKQIPSLFVPNVFCVMSDMSETRVGTITADEDRYVSWKSVDGDYSETKSATWRTMLDGMMPKARLLDIVKNFVCFNDDASRVIKILAGYHQYFGVKKAAERAVEAVEGDGKIGVFWHTQGSGKSLSMVFFAHLLQERLSSPTIVVITDRNDLDDQLYGQFTRCAPFLRQTAVQAESREHLKQLLIGREANGIIFTTMQKFMDGDEPLCDRSNVVVMVDEAHRGQYGLTESMDAEGNIRIGAARVVRKALPNASYIGFTGTPISTEDKNTREIFGEYIDVYDMTQSVEDNATRPVFYESRVVALKLNSDKLAQLDAAYSEFAEQANEASIEKAKRDTGGLDAIFGAPETIDALCRDIIEHYENNRADVLAGKALIVAYSRPVAMKIYYRMMELRPQWRDKLGVVMTMGNQDPEEWFDVCGGKSHKKEMERKFKKDDDPLKIAIVVDMWLTGFDVPSLATMYVFKPMKGHNLMQAIARVNRVCKGKEGGLVVDYIGIARALKRAMKDYTNRDQHNYGDMDVAATAYPKFLEKLDVCRDLMYGFDYAKTIFTDSKQQLAMAIAEGTDWLLEPAHEEDREDFVKQCQLMNQALSLCKSLVSEEDQHEAAYLSVLRVQVLRLTGRQPSGRNGMTYAEFNKRVTAILEQTVQADGVIDLFGKDAVEISLFDEAFLQELANMKQKNIAVESLKRLIKERVRTYQKTSVVKAEKFSDMLQSTLNAYLNGMLTNAQVIEELVNMAKEMMKDRSDADKLGLTDEEMAFYDAITKPQAVKDFYDNDQLVAITRELTEAMRSSATIDWQRKESARAGMRRTIKRLLRKYKYPPEGAEEAMATVMAQCELWADTKIYE